MKGQLLMSRETLSPCQKISDMPKLRLSRAESPITEAVPQTRESCSHPLIPSVDDVASFMAGGAHGQPSGVPVSAPKPSSRPASPVLHDAEQPPLAEGEMEEFLLALRNRGINVIPGSVDSANQKNA